MLSSTDPLPGRPERVLIAGVTGVGKTTLARRLHERWDLPFTELDSLFHGPGWTQRPEFADDVRAIAAAERWVSEWSYWSSDVGEILGDRGDTLVWLDFPRRIARGRLLRRTVQRRIRRQELWNGNVEPPLHTFFTRPDANILRWEMETHAKWRERMPEVTTRYPQLQIVRLAHPREVDTWLRGPAAVV